MKCTACKEENLIKAQYCRKCGHAFTQEERDAAYNQTIYGKIDKVLEMKGWADLSNFTSHPAVRIAVIAVLALLVLFNIFRNGNTLNIRNSDDYTIAYQQEYDEYYLLTEKESVQVDIYVPKAAVIVIETFDLEDELIYRGVVGPEDESVILTRSSTEYYVLSAEYENGGVESITFYVCEG